ncbi:UPF0545 protein C22orf39 homolog [Trichogramma pretiosum]|uniref:UPF0545 protein C22orf39 homolog n=1 Tax=Trichogramma pretiosum TaxID=7493 RepID=UPI0006C99D76|nr:UPF0545 protein C22orf39 homolog [Trichogramma pretiosum]
MTQANDNESLSNKQFLIRPCEIYKDEFFECERPRARVHQYFIKGDYKDCASWKEDYENCKLWMNYQNTNAYAALIESEKQRKLNRFQNHFRNRVWNKRSNAPENWNSQLPLWWTEKNKNNYFSCKSRQIKNGSLNDIDLEIYNACTIL